jgi:hypothetical protein
MYSFFRLLFIVHVPGPTESLCDSPGFANGEDPSIAQPQPRFRQLPGQEQVSNTMRRYIKPLRYIRDQKKFFAHIGNPPGVDRVIGFVFLMKNFVQQMERFSRLNTLPMYLYNPSPVGIVHS